MFYVNELKVVQMYSNGKQNGLKKFMMRLGNFWRQNTISMEKYHVIISEI
jgi:hypothetical protein